jgi:hypothetical protein
MTSTTVREKLNCPRCSGLKFPSFSSFTTQLQMVKEQGEEKLLRAHIDKTCRPAKAKPAPSSNMKSVTCFISAFSICMTRMFGDRLCSMAFGAYQSRSSRVLSLSSRAIW